MLVKGATGEKIMHGYESYRITINLYLRYYKNWIRFIVCVGGNRYILDWSSPCHTHRGWLTITSHSNHHKISIAHCRYDGSRRFACCDRSFKKKSQIVASCPSLADLLLQVLEKSLRLSQPFEKSLRYPNLSQVDVPRCSRYKGWILPCDVHIHGFPTIFQDISSRATSHGGTFVLKWGDSLWWGLKSLRLARRPAARCWKQGPGSI